MADHGLNPSKECVHACPESQQNTDMVEKGLQHDYIPCGGGVLCLPPCQRTLWQFIKSEGRLSHITLLLPIMSISSDTPAQNVFQPFKMSDREKWYFYCLKSAYYSLVGSQACKNSSSYENYISTPEFN